jgi:hypothetical protein
MQRNPVDDGAQAQDDVAPVLAAGWAVVEFAKQLALRGLVGMERLYTLPRQTVEDIELALAQALVGQDPNVGCGAACTAKRRYRIRCALLG